jgi:hypothetical protein
VLLQEDEMKLELGGSWTDGPYQMISGQGEAVSRPLKVATAANGTRWLYNDDLPNAGAFIYVEGGPNSQGFGGSTIPFKLVDGTTLELKGPWHSNSDALFKSTGIDLRERHVTWGCIGTERDYTNSRSTIRGLLYFDPEGGLEGPFNRIETMANAMAKERDVKLCYFSGSHGGSSCGFTRPSHD